MSEMDWNSAVYGTCSLGQLRHFWAAWRSMNEWYDQRPPFASDYETSRERAEERGRDAIRGLVATPDAQRMPIGYVTQYHRRLAIERRMQKPPRTQEAAPLEFLYTFRQSDFTNDWQVSSYRIVKKTAARLYVEKEPDRVRSLSEEHPPWWRFDVKTVVVNRTILEREGACWCPGLRDPVYVSPELPKSSSTPPCLEALELRAPCTERDVKRAFRRLSKETHPDRGGDASRFIMLQGAYEVALAYVQQLQPPEGEQRPAA